MERIRIQKGFVRRMGTLAEDTASLRLEEAQAFLGWTEGPVAAQARLPVAGSGVTALDADEWAR